MCPLLASGSTPSELGVCIDPAISGRYLSTLLSRGRGRCDLVATAWCFGGEISSLVLPLVAIGMFCALALLGDDEVTDQVAAFAGRAGALERGLEWVRFRSGSTCWHVASEESDPGLHQAAH